MFQVIQNTADKEVRDAKVFEKELNLCKIELQNTLRKFDDFKNNHSDTMTKKIKSIEYLTEDNQVKQKHIDSIEVSYKNSLQMLDQSQHRISELEEKLTLYEEELGQIKEKSTIESRQKNSELHNLIRREQNLQDEVKQYKKQLETITSTLQDSKQKIVELGEVVISKERQLIENLNEMNTFSIKIQSANNTKKEVECSFNELKMKYQHLEDEKNRIISTYTSELQSLKDQVCFVTNIKQTVENIAPKYCIAS